MEYKIYDYPMAAPGHPQINENDLLLLNNNMGHEICLPQHNNNSPPGGFCGGDVRVDVSAGHSTSGSSSKRSEVGSRCCVQKKKVAESRTKLSVDPQSVAARQRRHRISKRFRILQTLVPGGTKMDTASMLDEAIHYVKFLKYQIWFHEMMGYALNASNIPTNCSSLTNASSAHLVSPSLQVETDSLYASFDNAHSLNEAEAEAEADSIAYVCGQWRNN